MVVSVCVFDSLAISNSQYIVVNEEYMLDLFFTSVAVPNRNRILFRRVFRVHH